jgi:two-component system cell cycle sensor histidine kinase/response regulator CckA
MGTPLQVLIVEDSEDDAFLLVRELRRSGYDPNFERVDTPEAMAAALEKQSWDVILSDYVMPRFDGLAALKLLQRTGLDIPFIIVSGSIGEDTAVAAMKAGANDYLMKEKLARLIPAIQQELREAEVRRNLKVSQHALQESEKRYRQVVENATEIIYTVDVRGNFTYANPAGLKVTGYSLHDLRELNYADLVVPEHRERVAQIYINQFRERQLTTYIEFPFFSKAGEIIWFGQNSTLVMEDGKIIGFHMIARDITERKKAEQALAESEQRYRNLVENAPDVIFTLASNGTVASLNPAFEKITGWSQSEWLNKHFTSILHPDDLSRGLELFRLVMKGEKVAPFELRVLRKSGDYLTAEFTVTLQTQDGSVVGMLGIARDVTERQRAEDALRAEKERFRLAAESSTDLIYEWDIKERVDYFGKVDELLGYTPSEFPRTLEAWINSIHPDDRDRVEAAIKNHLEKNESYNIEYRVKKKDGTYNYWWARGTALRDGKGNPYLWIGSVTDITERKQAEEALRASEQKYRTLIENVPQKIFLKDKNSVYISCNENYANDLKIKSNEISGRSDYEFYQKELAEKYRTDDKKIMEEGKTEEVEEIYVQNGQEVWVNTIKTPVKDEKGNVVGILGIFWDITERKQAEEILRMTQFSLEHAPELVLWINSKGHLEYANEEASHILGYSREELISMSIWDINLNLIADRWSTHWQSLPNRGPTTRESSYRTKDGKIFPFEITGDYMKYGDKEYHVVFGRDITERKQAEEALRISEEKYRNILESIEDGYYEVDIAGNFTFFNDSMCRIYGYPREELMGMNNRQYTDQENAKKLFQAFNKVYRAGESTREFDWEIIGKDGTKRYVETSVSLIKDSSGNRVGFRGVVRDITERKRAEQEMTALQEQLRQSQKMEAIGQLAGGVAHDFNNLLTVIKGYSQLSLGETKEEDPLKENIEEIKKAADRAADLTRQLLAFSRRQIMEMKVLDINTTLQNLEKMLKRIIGEDVELVFLLNKDLGRVRTDPGQIEQVVLNLAVNARDAMRHGGKLTIETDNVKLDEVYAKRHVAVKPGPYVMLSVSDTGVGMTPEVRDRVFEPFFTTKEKGKGTGLGLSTVYGIVKQSGGNIWTYSELGKGTTFKIYLPMVEETLEEVEQMVMKGEPSRGSETVLLVEDDEEVRKLAVRILEKRGYRVLKASKGEEALSLCKEQQLIHLMVTDVVMPGMGGRELTNRLKNSHPEMKVLYMSGYTDNAIVHHGVLDKGMNFIQKPFTVDSLTRKVREVLDK